MSAVQHTSVSPVTPAAATDMVGHLAATASIEMTPRQVLSAPSMADLLPSGSTVYVPLLSGADRDQSVAACRELVAQAMRPVAHLPARAVPSRAALNEWLGGLRAVGVDSLLLIAGDGDKPAGPFHNTLDLLDSGLLEHYGFRRLAIAGHPGGHPVASDQALREALAIKQAYAAEHGCEMWMVTQFVFAAEPALRWLDAIRNAAGPLPIWIGLPGPSKLRTLLAFAAQCGLGSSARMLMRRPDAARLVRGWSPEPLLRELAASRAVEGAASPGGVHLYPFGGVRRCTDWLRELHAERCAASAGAPLSPEPIMASEQAR